MLSERKIFLLAVTALLMLPLLALGLSGPAEFRPPPDEAPSPCCCADSDGPGCDGPQKDCHSDGCTQCSNPACSKLVLFFETPDIPTLNERCESVEIPVQSARSRAMRPQVPPPDAV